MSFFMRFSLKNAYFGAKNETKYKHRKTQISDRRV